MVASPLLLAFYLLSYKEFARQHSQLFIAAFAVTLSICVYISVMLLNIETQFSIENGNGTMNFMLTLGALGAMPLGFVLTVLIGAAISVLHGLIMIHIPMATSWPNYLHISSMWTVACFIAFWREYQMRVFVRRRVVMNSQRRWSSLRGRSSQLFGYSPAGFFYGGIIRSLDCWRKAEAQNAGRQVARARHCPDPRTDDVGRGRAYQSVGVPAVRYQSREAVAIAQIHVLVSLRSSRTSTDPVTEAPILTEC